MFSCDGSYKKLEVLKFLVNTKFVLVVLSFLVCEILLYPFKNIY